MPNKARKVQSKRTRIVKPDTATMEDILTRGVTDVIPHDTFISQLTNGKRLRIYLGVDPTGPVIHLGHAVILRKLRALQLLGHEIILLVGDFTARIGDPTDRSAARVTMTAKEVLGNAKTYKAQAAKILDFSRASGNPARLEYNSRWLDKMRFQDVLSLATNFTVQQMLERDMFEKRMQEGRPIYIHEFLYPAMQGYDSVAMDVDMEVGGNDQTFNMLAGRTLQKVLNNREKTVMTFELLPGLDGRKMSKSYGNVIGIDDTPNDMYGRVMSVADELIVKYFWLCTDASAEDVRGIEQQLAAGAHPRDVKMRLAREIVSTYHSEVAAEKAEKEFVSVFQKKQAPTEVATYRLRKSDATIVDVIVNARLAGSKTEARRLIEQGGVRIDGEKIVDAYTLPVFQNGSVLQVGKRKFVSLQK